MMQTGSDTDEGCAVAVGDRRGWALEAMVVIDEMLVSTLSVARLTLLTVLLAPSVVHVVPEGCAGTRIPVIVVAILPFVVDGYWAMQEQPAIFWSASDLLKFMALSCPE